VVVRDVQRMSPELQRQMASVIEEDGVSGYGAKVRWILTGDEEIIGSAAEAGLDASLLNHLQNHLIRVPSIEEHREDLPLIVVRMLEWIGAALRRSDRRASGRAEAAGFGDARG